MAKTKIAPILNELFFYTKVNRGVSIPIRTVQELADVMTVALEQSHRYLDLYIDTGRLHFVDEPNPYNFDDFWLDTPFPTVRPAAAAPGTALTLDVNVFLAALAAHTATLSSTTSTTAPVGGSLTTTAGIVPVTNIFN